MKTITKTVTNLLLTAVTVAAGSVCAQTYTPTWDSKNYTSGNKTFANGSTSAVVPVLAPTITSERALNASGVYNPGSFTINNAIDMVNRATETFGYGGSTEAVNQAGLTAQQGYLKSISFTAPTLYSLNKNTDGTLAFSGRMTAWSNADMKVDQTAALAAITTFRGAALTAIGTSIEQGLFGVNHINNQASGGIVATDTAGNYNFENTNQVARRMDVTNFTKRADTSGYSVASLADQYVAWKALMADGTPATAAKLDEVADRLVNMYESSKNITLSTRNLMNAVSLTNYEVSSMMGNFNIIDTQVKGNLTVNATTMAGMFNIGLNTSTNTLTYVAPTAMRID